jgi:tetratricopeptide (TPR) repeat protein
VESVLAALGSLRRLAVVLEDLHWADSATLDLLEHVLARRSDVPVLGTWRLDDPTTPEATTAWWQRVRRMSGCATLDLQPLERDETATQIELLTDGAVDPALVARIHRRSRGQPLFTEQLVGLDEDDDLPRLLADLLDRRLAGLGPDAEAIARSLGVADRALPDTLLTEVVERTPAAVAAGLHELADRRLLRAGSGHQVELSHPLLAEAARRRLLALELVEVHRRLAHALAGTANASPAEVAEHWRGAEDPAEEVVWRVAAALAAAHRFALVQAAEQWQRALVLWPDGAESVGTPPVRRHDAVLAALDALRSTDVPAAWALAERTMSAMDGATGADAAALYRRASDLRALLADSRGALELVERAVGIHRSAPPTVEYVRALQEQGDALTACGRFDEAADTTSQALQICADLDAPSLHRILLVQDAYRLFDAGDPAGALSRLEEAADLEVDGPDPEGDIAVAVARADILREAGAAGDEVAEAGRPGLEAAAAWGLDTRDALSVRSNTAAALRLSGQVRRAAELIDPVTVRDRPVHREQVVHEERALLDALRGRAAEALARLDLVDGLPVPGLMNRMESAEKAAGTLLWCGRPQTALDRLLTVLRDALALPASALPASAYLGADLALAARAAADVADACGASRATRRDLRSHLEGLRARTLTDPFALGGGFVLRPAHGAAWVAELARLVGTPSLHLWAAAAGHWDRVGRPHEAAYCRWRAAQLALADGRRTVAQRLLRRAAYGAREHVPLSAAIADTARSAA